jgi:class 3 adenylate cyclase
VEMLFAMSLPALVIGLTVLGVLELVAHRRDGRTRRRHGTASMMGFDIVQELFAPAKRYQIEQREHEALLYEEDAEGAPPRTRIDIDKGTAQVVLAHVDHTVRSEST